MNLKAVSNERLLNDLKTKVESERKLLMEILHALREVEIRHLHLAMGYPDLYTFAIKELGYSAGAAYRRISAMRLLQTVPEVAPKLESGELGLENASQAQSFFRKEDQRRKEQGEIKLSLKEKREVITDLLGKSTREGQRVLIDHSPDIMMPVEKTRPLPEQKTLVQFIAPAELMKKLEELKHILAHKNFEGRMDVLIDQLADIALKELKPSLTSKSKPASQSKSQPDSQSWSQPAAEAMPKPATNRPAKIQPERIQPKKERIHQSTDTTDNSNPSPAPGVKNSAQPTPQRSRYIPRSRYISIEEKRKVLQRDQKGCTFKSLESGRICQSRHGLQFEHIVPFSQGGSHQADNLTLHCSAHNLYQAKRLGLARSGS